MSVAPDPRPDDGAPAAADAVAVTLSMACLLHCLALPLLAAGLPAFGLLTEHHETVHWILLAVAAPLGLWALGRGRRHAGPWPLALGCAGLMLMALGVGLWHGAPAELWATVAGVSLVGWAHIRNWQAARARPRHTTSRTSAP